MLVLEIDHPKVELDVCSIVSVVNGGLGFLLIVPSFTDSSFSVRLELIESNANFAKSVFEVLSGKCFPSSSSHASGSSDSWNRTLSSTSFDSTPTELYSLGTCSSLSSSFSTIYPSVGVWTLPIDFNFHERQNLEHLKPTSLSISRLTIAASTRSMSSSLGLDMAVATASFVISLNETLFTESKSDNISASLQAMNSPSLSGSVAMKTSSTPDFFAFDLIFDITRSALSVHDQGGLGNSPGLEAHMALELSLDLRLDGKSCTCPLHASTIHPFPRYFLIVFALAPDSRITSFISTPRI